MGYEGSRGASTSYLRAGTHLVSVEEEQEISLVEALQQVHEDRSEEEESIPLQ